METLSSKYINVNGSLLDLSGPCVMGILNITPDSFYAGSRMQTEAEIAARAHYRYRCILFPTECRKRFSP